MSRFAIWFNGGDLQFIADSINSNKLTNTQRQDGQRYWNAGLSGWATAPVETDHHAGGDPDCRRIVISIADPRNLETFKTLIRGIATDDPSLAYLGPLANSLVNHSDAAEDPYTGP